MNSPSKTHNLFSSQQYQQLRRIKTSNQQEFTNNNLCKSQKLSTPESTQNKEKKDVTSIQLMNNLNTSFDGLFSRIQQIKEQHTVEIQNDQNYDRFPKFNLKTPKLPGKPFSMKQLSSLPINDSKNANEEKITASKQNEKNLPFAGLLSVPNLKASMQITEDHLQGTQNNKSLKTFDKIQYTNSPGKEETLQKGQALSISDFELGKCVGSGKFGDVFICKHKKTQSLYALKKVFKSTIMEYKMVEQFTRELRIHYCLNHPNIVKLFTHFDDEYHIFLLMEYAEGGILLDKLKSTQEYASRIIQQTINGIEYLHSKKIAHRDIKPENIVLQFDSVAKICDFGWSSFYRNEMKKTFCGTLEYISPEMMENSEYDSSVDIWSIGVLTYELLIGSAPYKKQLNEWNKGGMKRNKSNWNIIYPPVISTVAESFMRNLLKEKPEERCSLKFCLNHYFIRKHKQNMEEKQQILKLNSIL